MDTWISMANLILSPNFVPQFLFCRLTSTKAGLKSTMALIIKCCCLLEEQGFNFNVAMFGCSVVVRKWVLLSRD